MAIETIIYSKNWTLESMKIRAGTFIIWLTDFFQGLMPASSRVRARAFKQRKIKIEFRKISETETQL